MVGKHKQVHVLIAELISIRHDTWITTKCITGFTHEYLPLVSDYSQVRTKHTTRFSREYIPLVSDYSPVQKCTPGVTM